MDQMFMIVQFILEKGPLYLSAVVGVLSALIALFILIPGEQPEKALQSVVDLIAKISRK